MKESISGVIVLEVSTKDLGLRPKVRSIVEKNIFKDDKNTEIPVTISLGISCYPDNVDNPEDLVNTADKGLYNAKRNGRNQVSTDNSK